MKKLIILLSVIMLSSCATTNNAGLIPEDEIFVTRKYIGNFIEYRHTDPDRFGDPHIIWIKTTMEDVYGKVSAYSKKCDFKPGDRLYLRRVYVSPGVWGYWEYQVENDMEKPVFYTVSEFQYDGKMLVQNWF